MQLRRHFENRASLRAAFPAAVRHSLLSLTLPALLTMPAMLGHAADAGAVVHWTVDEKGGCTTGSATFSCGKLGHFSFSPIAFPPERTPDCADSTLGGGRFVAHPYAHDLPDDQEALPCADGSCLSGDGMRLPVADVLVIDWDDPHGWSVAGIIDRLAGGGATLGMAAFDSSNLITTIGAGVTDAHVLEQVCRIVELPVDDRPLLVNMSFGRPAPGNWESECTGRTSITCEVDRALRELDQSGVHLVAAAGHHGRQLFPASSGVTWSAGAVDLVGLGHSKSVPAAHTPAEADLLVPGYGVFVGASLGNVRTWSAPPGSSYSAAVASGWIIDSMLADPGADAFLRLSRGQRVKPVQPTAEAWALGLDASLIMPGSLSERASVLLQTALGEKPGQCSNFDVLAVRELVLSGDIATLPTLMLDDARGDLTIPCPESFPCVPCHDMPDGQPLGGGEKAVSRALEFGATPGPLPVQHAAGERLEIDLSGSKGFDRDAYELLGIYLRVANQDLEFTDSRDGRLLRDLADGSVDVLLIEDAPAALWHEQGYLVFHLRLADEPLAGSETFGPVLDGEGSFARAGREGPASRSLRGRVEAGKGLTDTVASAPEIVQRVPITVHGH